MCRGTVLQRGAPLYPFYNFSIKNTPFRIDGVRIFGYTKHRRIKKTNEYIFIMKCSVSSYCFGSCINEDPLGFLGIINKAVEIGFSGIDYAATSNWTDKLLGISSSLENLKAYIENA